MVTFQTLDCIKIITNIVARNTQEVSKLVRRFLQR